LEERARQVPDKPFLLYRDEHYSYAQMNDRANQAANYLMSLGGGKGKGLGLFMRNSPRFLDLFFGAQRIGMYLVPINPALIGEGLGYVLRHSDIELLALDAELLSSLEPVLPGVPNLKTVIVDDLEEEAKGIPIPPGFQRLRAAYEKPREDPGIGYNKEDIFLILYTSGTTGPPKGVVYRYANTTVKKLCLLAGILYCKNDTFYTCLPLIHGKALFLTVTPAMAVKGAVGLSRRFSASRFWDEIRQYRVSTFNALGSMIPILMKQPERPEDKQHNVRLLLSAACPAEMWGPFEERFGVRIFEAYGAVDGGGMAIMNLGTAPKGSIGKPPGKGRSFRIVDDAGQDVHLGMSGKLIYHVGDGKRRVEYYKDPHSSNEKVKDGWLYTGDIVRKDDRGFFYFVGRKTESMRVGGENVSAYEVEHALLKHPAVEEVAVYAVPSELAEDEIMASVKLVEGQRLREEELHAYLKDHLPKYALPRYIKLVSELPKTSTHRVIKKELERLGIAEGTYDAKIGAYAGQPEQSP
jgi:crotonobetaine/carnitine-CoA ligase